MFTSFVLSVVMLLTASNMGFQQGQENPNANNLFDSHSKVFVDDRAYGVDIVDSE